MYAIRSATTAIIALCLALCVAACSQPAAEVKQEPMPVRVASATSGPGAPTISTNGLIVNKEEMRLSFKVTGVIRRIAVEEGQPVKAGQQLAEIELAEIDAQVEQARVMESKAQRDLERGEKLYAQRLISLGQVQDLRTEAEMARSRLKSTQFNRAHSVITAPADGVVLRKLAEERELISAGQPVLLIGTRQRGYVVRAALADREIVQLKLGDVAEIRMDAYPGQTIAGAVSELASAADEKSGMFQVEVRFAAPVALASGMVARLQLQPASASATTRTYVPIEAVIEGDGDRADVFVVDGAQARRRPIRVAFFTPQAVALEDGLHPGERIVTEGAQYLEDGEDIAILPANAQSVHVK